MWRTIVYTGHTDGVRDGPLHEMDCAEGCSSVTSDPAKSSSLKTLLSRGHKLLVVNHSYTAFSGMADLRKA